MGLALTRSSFFTRLFRKKEVRIVMVGLDGAGKTTILYKLKQGDGDMVSLPTSGFNVETVEYKNSAYTVWDFGGQRRMRPLWHHYTHNTQGLIFVVDSSDAQRIDEAKRELAIMLTLKEDELKDAVILVFANKQDKPNAMTAAELTDALNLNNLRNRWNIQTSCASQGRGLCEGMDWLCNELAK